MATQTLPNLELDCIELFEIDAISLSPVDQALQHANFAKDLLEQGNQLLLKAGEELRQAKELAKKKFGKLLKEVELAKPQVNKLIKAAEIAEDVSVDTASKLGLFMLLQLGQPKNINALQALANDSDVTQVQAVEVIKEKRIPPTPKLPKKPLEWEQNKYGDRQLVLRITDGDPAMNFEKGFKESGLPSLQQYISQLLNDNAFDGADVISPVDEQAMPVVDEQAMPVVDEQAVIAQKVLAESIADKLQSAIVVDKVVDEQAIAQQEFDEYIEVKIQSAIPETPVANDTVTATPIKVGDWVHHSDPWDTKNAYCGFVEQILNGKALVNWEERKGRPGLTRDWYEFNELKLISVEPETVEKVKNILTDEWQHIASLGNRLDMWLNQVNAVLLTLEQQGIVESQGANLMKMWRLAVDF